MQLYRIIQRKDIFQENDNVRYKVQDDQQTIHPTVSIGADSIRARSVEFLMVVALQEVF